MAINPEYRPRFHHLPKESETEVFKEFPLPESEKIALSETHYILCNEEGQKDILQQLSKVEKPEKGVHIGFSCWLNYEILAVREPSLAVICDFDDNMITLLDLIGDLIVEADHPEAFIRNLYTSLETTLKDDFVGIIDAKGTCFDLNAFGDEMKKGGWLSNDVSFNTVKRMYQEGRVIHRKLDLCTTNTTFSKIKDWTAASGHVIDTVYISNIPDWVATTSSPVQEAAKHNVESLLGGDAHLVAAWKDDKHPKHPYLHLCKDSYPEFRPPRLGKKQRRR